MVTKCPIAVQMGSKSKRGPSNEHTAQIYIDGQGSEAGTITCDGDSHPNADDLEVFAGRIREEITAKQNYLIGRVDGLVSSEKIIVRFRGPSFPNLSLVDLPGLRTFDGRGMAGMKEEIDAMVTKAIGSSNSVILAVGDSSGDPDTWLGRGKAQKADPTEERTTLVVTKADKIIPAAAGRSRAASLDAAGAA